MKSSRYIWIAVVVGAMLMASCAQEVCPGAGNYQFVAPRKITHNSSKYKVRESMIHSHKPNGRKPPKRNY